MDRRQIGCLICVVILLSWVSVTFADTVSEEAQRHFDRGMAAVEMAKSQDDYAPAIKEFEQAKRLAPDWADVYYNLGMVQEKAEKYSDAVTNFKQYLRLAPNASDAATVKSLINKLEFKAEQEITREVALDIFGSLSDTTKWRFVGESSAYKNWVKGFRRDGNRILMTYEYRNDLKRWTTGTTYGDELPGKTLTLRYKIWFPNFCDSPDCGVLADYIFKIVSKSKVQVKAVELWPKIQNYQETLTEEKTERLTFEYIRIF